jgi:ATP-dependent Clp protease adapter protein ClpS
MRFLMLAGTHESTTESPVLDEIRDDEAKKQEPAKVILFNDEIHTFDEVIGQIIKATGCDSGRAEAIAWEVHTRGKAVVFDGAMNRCLQVSGVLEEIGLHTTIEV